MDVELPNGYVIKDVPEGTPKEVIMQKAISAGIATEQDFATESPPPEDLPERPTTFRDRVAGVRDNIAGAIDGGVDVVKVAGSSMMAQPLAGLAGLADQMRLVPGNLESFKQGAPLVRESTPYDRANTVKQTQSALTMEPTTPQGQQALETVGRFMQPVTDYVTRGQEYLGDKGYEMGGPVLGAAGYTAIPALIEGAGLGVAARTAKGMTGVKNAPMNRKVGTALKEATPSGAQLKASSSGLFKEIDELGVTVKAKPFQELVDSIKKDILSKGADPETTRRAWRVLERLDEDAGKPLTLSEVETLREVAKGASASTNKHEAMLGMTMQRKIDNFLEDLEPGQLETGGNNANRVGVLYRNARKEWGQYRRSEMLDKAIGSASYARSGFENGLRQEFTNILKGIEKGKIHGFKDHEIAAMQRVADGTAGSNVAREIGKMGLAGGKLGNNWLGAFLTGSAAFTLGGLPASVAAVLTGTAFKKLALRLTKGNADFAQQVIRAGDNAKDITEAYIRFTPKAQRSADELSLLLMHKDIDLAPLNRFRLEAQAAELALKHRTQLAGALAGGSGTDERTR